MLFPFIYISLPLQFPKSSFSSGYLKVLLDVFHIQYANIEATLPAWRAKTTFKSVVPGDLAPHQMFRFYHEFVVMNMVSYTKLMVKPEHLVGLTKTRSLTDMIVTLHT